MENSSDSDTPLPKLINKRTQRPRAWINLGEERYMLTAEHVYDPTIQREEDRIPADVTYAPSDDQDMRFYYDHGPLMTENMLIDPTSVRFLPDGSGILARDDFNAICEKYTAYVDRLFEKRKLPVENPMIGSRDMYNQLLIFNSSRLDGADDDMNKSRGPYVRIHPPNKPEPINVHLFPIATSLYTATRVRGPDELLKVMTENNIPHFLTSLKAQLTDQSVIVFVLPESSIDDDGLPSFDLWMFLHVWPVLQEALREYPIYVVQDQHAAGTLLSMCVIHVVAAVIDSYSIDYCTKRVAESDDPAVDSVFILAGHCPRNLISLLPPDLNVTVIGSAYKTFGSLFDDYPDIYNVMHDVSTYRVPSSCERSPVDMHYFLGQFPRNPLTCIPIVAGYAPERYQHHPSVAGYRPLILADWEVSKTRFAPIVFY